MWNRIHVYGGWEECLLGLLGTGVSGRHVTLTCVTKPREYAVWGSCPQICISILAYLLEKQGSLVSFVKCLCYQKHFSVGAKPLVPLTQGR